MATEGIADSASTPTMSYKSVDGGKSWKLKNAGITQSEPFAWRIVRDSKGTLYVLVARLSEDGSIGTEEDGAIYKSTDGADTWSQVTLPEGSNAPNGLAADPSAPDRLYLAARARNKGEHGEGGGIFLSLNAGKTWTQVLDRDRHVYDVTIDPRDARILYASGFESSAWKSNNHVGSWTRIPGFNFKWGHRVIADPEDPKKVYITTFGGASGMGPWMEKIVHWTSLRLSFSLDDRAQTSWRKRDITKREP